MRLGVYVQDSSILHSLDPRVKIGSAVAVSLALLGAGAASCAVLSILILAAVREAKIPPGSFLRTLKPGLPFLALLFLLHALFTPGQPSFPSWGGPAAISLPGLYLGAVVSWRFALLLATGALLTMTTSPGELTAALERLLKPLRPLGVPYQDIAVMVALALRFLPTLLEEMQRVRDAQLSRCAGFARGGLRRRASTAAALILPVSLGVLRRAEELAVAMEARGYTHGPRTGLNELHIGHKDWAAGLITALVLAGIRGLENLGTWW